MAEAQRDVDRSGRGRIIIEKHAGDNDVPDDSADDDQGDDR
jgi:hypothetical protein